MEITTDLVESMKKNRDVSPHRGFCNSKALCVVPLFAICVRTLYLCSGIIYIICVLLLLCCMFCFIRQWKRLMNSLKIYILQKINIKQLPLSEYIFAPTCNMYIIHFNSMHTYTYQFFSLHITIHLRYCAARIGRLCNILCDLLCS